MAQFEEYPHLHVTGNVFFIVYLVLNVLLLTNYVVAIMTDRYSALQESRQGLFYDDIIRSMADYKQDKRYGFLIVNTAPLSLVSLLAAPLLLFVKSDTSLRQMNSVLLRIGYLPVAIASTAVFLASNALMCPIAYLAALAKKLQLALIARSKTAVSDLVTFALCGWAMLAISVVIDAWLFA
jgi:hypothetical protein